jgi:hypothetical protein
MQIFTPDAVLALKLGALGACVLVVAGLLSWRTAVAPQPATDASVEQAIPFSHKHHAGDDGIDCRYCHATVETSAFAGIPPLSTCMTCHSQIFADAPMLALLRSSFAQGQGLTWRRVHHLPEFAYFDHSIHLAKGIGCSTCHGPVDRMPLTRRVASLHMEWCLDCHRNPSPYLRTQDEIFDMRWQAPPDQPQRAALLRSAYQLHPVEVLTACSTCHR